MWQNTHKTPTYLSVDIVHNPAYNVIENGDTRQTFERKVKLMATINLNDMKSVVLDVNGNNSAYYGVGCILIDPFTHKTLAGVRSDTKTIATPGGKREKGESPLQAVVREVKEETGVRIRSCKLYGVTPILSATGVVYLSFLFVSDDFDAHSVKRQESEFDSLEWMDIGDLCAMPDETVFEPTRVSFDLLFDDGFYRKDSGGVYDANPYIDEMTIQFADAPATPSEAQDSCNCAYSICVI